MKRNSKRRHPFVVVYSEQDENGEQQTYFVGMLQSPKVPERYAHYWALKKVREYLKEGNIPFENWANYEIYPVNRFNCCQWDLKEEDMFYGHIHVADNDKEDDEAQVRFDNQIKSKWKPHYE